MQEHPDNPPVGTPGQCLVIVPAYNEAGSIAQVVNDLRKHLPQADVLVVDDGSTDGTLAAVPGGTPVLRLLFNLGIGGAMQAGYLYAQAHGYDVAIQVDGDGQHPADQVHKLIAALARTDADLVIGSRFLSDDPGFASSVSRAAGIRAIRTVVRLLTGLSLTDCTSGFRAANRRVIDAFVTWYPDDYPEPEVILLLHRAGFTVRETPVTMRPRTTGRTSIPFIHGVFYIIKVTAALLLDLVRDPWCRRGH